MTDNPTPTEIYRQLRRYLDDLRLSGVSQVPGEVHDWLPAFDVAVPAAAAGMDAAKQGGVRSPDKKTDNPAGDVATRPSVQSADPDTRTNAPSGRTAPLLAGADDPFSSLPPISVEERKQALMVLADEVSRCTRCPELVDSRSQTVFGVGPAQPRLCFFGEAPGADEDRKGEPFVGRAGQLLDKMIAAMGLARHDVYILNTIKCRPPLNRNPEPGELRNCRQHWERQLEILRPELICCLGGFAAKSLLETDWSVGRLRGKIHDYRGSKVVVTYHPAYLLRNEYAKRYAWEDLQSAMRELGLERPAR